VGGADEVVFDQRQLAFGEATEAVEEPLADETAQDGIAQELKALVVRREFAGL